MFDIFSRNKKQLNLSPELYHVVMKEFTQMANHMHVALEIDMMSKPHIMEMELSDARKRISAVRLEIQAGYANFQNVVRTLPDANFIFTEIHKLFNALNSFVDNQAEWCELINRPTFDIFNLSDKSKYQQYVINNRRFAEQVEFQKIRWQI